MIPISQSSNEHEATLDDIMDFELALMVPSSNTDHMFILHSLIGQNNYLFGDEQYANK